MWYAAKLFIRFAFATTAVAGSDWGGTAAACSRCVWWVTPSGGDVPANLPGIRFGFLGPPLTPPMITVTELVDDGTERPVALTFPLGNLARFEQPLTEGSRYRVTHPGCGEFEEFSFRAVAAAPMPADLGRLDVGEVFDDVRTIPSSSSDCGTMVNVRGALVTLVLSDAARPWANALEGQWHLDNGTTIEPGDVFAVTPSDWTKRFVVQICSIVDGDVEVSPTEPPTSVSVTAAIPGSDFAIAPAETSLAFACEEEGTVETIEGGPSDVHDSDEGTLEEQEETVAEVEDSDIRGPDGGARSDGCLAGDEAGLYGLALVGARLLSAFSRGRKTRSERRGRKARGRALR